MHEPQKKRRARTPALASRLWLLPSGPDQVGRYAMRGGPPARILHRSDLRNINLTVNSSPFMLLASKELNGFNGLEHKNIIDFQRQPSLLVFGRRISSDHACAVEAAAEGIGLVGTQQGKL